MERKGGVDKSLPILLSSRFMVMLTQVRVDVAALGGSTTLAGRLAGEATRPALDEAIGRETSNAAILLDFGGVQLVTSSYFLGAFEWLWNSRVAREKELFPVLADVNPESRDEIELALKATGYRTLFWEPDQQKFRPFGLDRDATETYDRVVSLEQATATDLFRQDPRIQQTGWSNRLALLYEQRLLSRYKYGRQFVYVPLWR